MQQTAGMTTHPVQLHVETPAQMGRVHVLIRLALLIALASIAGSSLCWALYLALPAIAALLISAKGAERYHAEHAPGMTRVLRWIAAAYAYLWLLTDAPPSAAVDLQLEPEGSPATGSALLRLIFSLPALLVLAVLSFMVAVLWVIGALWILAARRIPHALASFFALTLRYQLRLFAYHLSLVDRYPSFEEKPVALPQSGAA